MDVNRNAGVWRTKDLRIQAWTPDRIRAGVRAGDLRRVRRGWYATPGAPDAVVRAVSAGGCLACASALAFHGAWDAAGNVLHVRTDHNHTQPLPSGMRRCQPGGGPDRAPGHAVDDVATALRSAWRCLGEDDIVAVCESLVYRGLMTPSDITCAVGQKHGEGSVLARMDRAESGTETLVRLRLRRRGIMVATQVWISGVGRVDLLVGERLVIEVDSRAHHTGVENYRSDRRRDLALRAMGYEVVRLTYEQVMHQWPTTEQSLLAMIRRGDQWWGSRRGRRRA